MLRLILALSTFIYVTTSYSIPSYVRLCKGSDPLLDECLKKSLVEILPYAKGGIPEMNIPPIEPYTISSFTVNTNSAADVNLEAVISNGTVYGIGGLVPITTEGDLAQLTFHTIFFYPTIKIIADYEIKGHIQNLPIDSRGRLEFNAINVTTTSLYKGHTYINERKIYAEYDKPISEIEMDDRQLHVENLFNGDQELTESIAKTIKEELRPLVEETLKITFLNIFNHVYSVFPIDVLFPENLDVKVI